MRWMWRELTRPRGPTVHRFYRVGRGSRAGVALLMAITAIMMLTVLVTEVSHGAQVRAQVAAQHRDEIAAEALAQSGAQFYRMILMASAALSGKPMIEQLGAAFGVNASELWQALPFIDTSLMRLLFVTDGDVGEGEVLTAKAEGLSDEQRDASRESSSLLNRSFLDFHGDFHAEVTDVERRVFVGKLQAANLGELLALPAAQEIIGLLSREEYHSWLSENNLIKEELVANLADWTDADDVRLYQGGSEDSVYQRLDDPYRSKNAPFDTRDEIRLVDGWNLDGVWERAGRHLTIYGGGKINVNTATQPVIRALLVAFAEGVATEATVEPILQELMTQRGTPLAEGGLYFKTPQQFTSVLRTLGLPLRSEINQAITTESKVFRIHSSGQVGSARAEIHAVLDFTEDPTGRVVFWRLR